MTKEEFKTLLEQKETLKEQTEKVYLQIVGQINLLKELITKEENSTVAK